MATNAPTPTVARSFDVAAAVRNSFSQFRDLNPNQPGEWPLLPRAAVWLVAAAAIVVLGWFVLLTDEDTQLQTERDKEPALKTEYRAKLAQAINLEALKRQKEQVQEYVTQLEKQLPGKAEMDALLSDINNAGVGRGLVINEFVPGNFEVKDYYVELPIALKVTGHYHEIGAFAADIAALSRIVTLNNLSIQGSPSGLLTLDAQARTYRYLDPSEVALQRKSKDKDKK